MTLKNTIKLRRLIKEYNKLVEDQMRWYDFKKYDEQSARAEVECKIVNFAGKFKSIPYKIENLICRGYWK